ncbi:MAG TPA: sensor domain-containing diguanylate cyclase [Coriobacteriia bacterium]
MDESKDAPQEYERTHRRLNVAIAGGDLRAAAMLRLLVEVDSITVAALAEPRSGAAAAVAAREIGIYTCSDVADLSLVEGLDVIIDLTDDPELRARLVAYRPAAVEIVGARGADLIRDLLMAKKRGEEQEKLLSELKVAYDKIRGHEQKLQVGTQALEKANEELETRLSEIFFTHEFFKALTSFTSVDDVTSLVVDGANGILGAEISSVYLLDMSHWVLRFATAQGRPREYFVDEVPVDTTILGRAHRDGLAVETDAHAIPDSVDWTREPDDVKSHAAVSLRSGEHVVGVLVIGSATSRELTAAELDRLQVIGNQSSLALQNALLHGELERLSVTDRLTELYNHGYFQQRLEEEIGRAERFGHVLSLIMIDIDDFKLFNDTYGHPRGDRVLRSVSDAITSTLRDIDFAARYGGEEFVVVLPETDAAGAAYVAERIRSEVEKLSFASIGVDPSVRKTISVGVATFPTHAHAGAPLIVAADQAMYAAKRNGKNTVVVAG